MQDEYISLFIACCRVRGQPFGVGENRPETWKHDANWQAYVRPGHNLHTVPHRLMKDDILRDEIRTIEESINLRRGT